MTFLPVRSARFLFARLAMVGFGVIGLAVAYAFWSEGNKLAALAALLFGVGLLVAAVMTGRNGYQLDGTSIGWRNGMTGVVSAVDLRDVQLVTATGRAGFQNAIVWTPTSGLGPVAKLFSSAFTATAGPALQEAEARVGKLYPFQIWTMALGEHGREQLWQALRDAGIAVGGYDDLPARR